MIRQLYIFLFITVITAAPSLACFPDPAFEYDEISSSDVSILTATVTAVELETYGDKTCWRVSYLNASYLYGNGEAEFSISTCAQEVWQLDVLTEEDDGPYHLGFVPEAEVLTGLVKNDATPLKLRYAIPSCWGPLHINLSILSREERESLLQDVQRKIKDIQ